MSQLQTLGDVLTCGLVLAAVLIVPFKLARMWGPVLRARLMSLFPAPPAPIEAVDPPGCHPLPAASHPIAITSTAVNEGVTVNAGDAAPVTDPCDRIPTEAREIIRLYAKAEAIADLIQAGLVTNQARAIEAVYHCSRTSASRPETPYQKARAQIERLTSPRPTYYDDLRAKVEAESEVKTA